MQILVRKRNGPDKDINYKPSHIRRGVERGIVNCDDSVLVLEIKLFMPSRY